MGLHPRARFARTWSSAMNPNLSKHGGFLAFWLSLRFGSFLLFLVCHDTAFLLSTRAMTKERVLVWGSVPTVHFANGPKWSRSKLKWWVSNHVLFNMLSSLHALVVYYFFIVIIKENHRSYWTCWSVLISRFQQFPLIFGNSHCAIPLTFIPIITRWRRLYLDEIHLTFLPSLKREITAIRSPLP